MEICKYSLDRAYLPYIGRFIFERLQNEIAFEILMLYTIIDKLANWAKRGTPLIHGKGLSHE